MGDHQVNALLAAPDLNTLNLPLHAVAAERIHAYLERSARHLANPKVPLFMPMRVRQTGAGVTANIIYTLVW
ncbi:hypothetical protein JQR84_23405 (plasmid) [Pseudomonas luteola]|uniref:hypothetical protein n=1 Tax=Pseudomonas TaxID=286 RepID=UPI003D9FF868